MTIIVIKQIIKVSDNKKKNKNKINNKKIKA